MSEAARGSLAPDLLLHVVHKWSMNDFDVSGMSHKYLRSMGKYGKYKKETGGSRIR